MIHLVTVVGESARYFYLKQKHQSDFKSLLRTVTSGRVLIVSTKFRSDLFYSSDKSKNESILKLWALYVNADLSELDQTDLVTSVGVEDSLARYFQSINHLSTHWYRYGLYQKAFFHAFSNDHENPVAQTVVGCDRYLVEHPKINRSPLVDADEKVSSKLTDNTFALAMRIIKNETHLN